MKRPLSLCLSLSLSALATAEILNVPGSYETIQGGIDAASTGDIVLVAPGAYFEVIDFLGKAITVRSEAGPEETSIKAPTTTAASTVTFNSKESSAARFEGFRVGGGRGTVISDPIFGVAIVGGAVFCSDSHPIIEGCEFVANAVGNNDQIGHGGGMFIRRSYAIVRNCDFLKNSASGHGGAIYINENSDASIEECRFDLNSASWGGAITCAVSCSPLLLGCHFTNNHVSNVGGGVYIRSSSSPRIEQCSFIDNVQEGNPGAGGAAITIYGSGNGGGPCFPFITETLFEGNRAEGYGGAVHNAYGGAPTFVACTFIANIGEAGGGGIDSIGHPDAPPTSLEILSCRFEGNETNGNGGAIDLRGVFASIADCNINSNTALSDGGGIAFNNSELSLVASTSICGNTPNQTTGDFINAGGNTIGELCESCDGDFNKDGFVDSADLGLLLAQWGTVGSGDLNNDGVVNAADLGLELAYWGPCGS
jgi:parallel beta-helix repeat protein